MQIHQNRKSASPTHERVLRRTVALRSASVMLAALCSACVSLPTDRGHALTYTQETRSLAPIPPDERHLVTVRAVPYYKVSDMEVTLESPVFDRQGNLLFVDIEGGRILRLSPNLELTTLFTDETLRPAGLAIHKNGQIFVAGLGDHKAGRIIALDADGGNPKTIVPDGAGYVADDLVFSDDGDLYFTDIQGNTARPTGGVYHLAVATQTVTPVLPNLVAANGVALSPDGKVLWATEFGAGRLHRTELDGSSGIVPFGSSIPYRFTGTPDSARTDADGNVYVAMFGQGKVLVFNAKGLPIGQILLPGREDNAFLRSTSMAFFPDSNDMVIVAMGEPDRGTFIFKARGFAKGTTPYSHK